jgi:hypothetical protein
MNPNPHGYLTHDPSPRPIHVTAAITLPRRSSAGKIKRSGPGYSKYFKEKAYKKAIVTFGDDITDDIPSVST